MPRIRNLSLLVAAVAVLGICLPVPATGAPATWTVTSLTDADAGTSGSLRWALGQATAGDTVTFDAALFAGGPQTMTLALGEVGVFKSVTIDGPGSGQLTLDASNSSRVFNLGFDAGAPGAVTIEGLTAAHGNAGSGGGGGLQSYNASVTLTDVAVTGSTAVNVGGGVLLANGGTAAPLAHTLSHVTLSGNSVTGSVLIAGAGLAVVGGCTACSGAPDTLSLTDSTVSGNNAPLSRGGGLGAQRAALTMTRATVSGNTGQWVGGGIYALSSTVALASSTISGNITGGPGGGLYLEDPTGSSVTTTTFSDNQGGSGGAIGVDQMPTTGTFTVSRSTFTGNTARGDGGAIYAYDNNTPGSGGMLVVNSTFQGNEADWGGAIRLSGDTGPYPPVVVRSCTITGNRANYIPGGGGISADGAITISRSVLSGNTLTQDAVTHASDLMAYSATYPAVVTDSLVGKPVGYVDAARNLPASTSPRLGALADNGGPVKTRLPLAGSPLINAGGTSAGGAPATDARGLARLSGGAYDIGAVETQAPSAPRNLTGAARIGGAAVAWLAPATAGDFAVSGYRLQARLGSGAWRTLATVRATQRNYSATGLLPRRTYTFRVVAVSAAGSGPAASTTVTTR